MASDRGCRLRVQAARLVERALLQQRIGQRESCPRDAEAGVGRLEALPSRHRLAQRRQCLGRAVQASQCAAARLLQARLHPIVAHDARAGQQLRRRRGRRLAAPLGEVDLDAHRSEAACLHRVERRLLQGSLDGGAGARVHAADQVFGLQMPHVGHHRDRQPLLGRDAPRRRNVGRRQLVLTEVIQALARYACQAQTR